MISALSLALALLAQAEQPKQVVEVGPVTAGAYQFYTTVGFTPGFAYTDAAWGPGIGGDFGASFRIAGPFRLGGEVGARLFSFDAPLIVTPTTMNPRAIINLSVLMLGVSVLPHLHFAFPSFTLDFALGFKLGIAASEVAYRKDTTNPDIYSLDGNRPTTVFPMGIARVLAMYPISKTVQFGIGVGFDITMLPVVAGFSFPPTHASTLHFDVVFAFGAASSRKTIEVGGSDSDGGNDPNGGNSTRNGTNNGTTNATNGGNGTTNTNGNGTDSGNGTGNNSTGGPESIGRDPGLNTLSDQAQAVTISAPIRNENGSTAQNADLPGAPADTIQPLLERVCHNLKSVPEGADVVIVVSFQSYSDMQANSAAGNSYAEMASSTLNQCSSRDSRHITIKETALGLETTQPTPLRVITIIEGQSEVVNTGS